MQACPSVLEICGAHLELTGLVHSMRNAGFIITSAQLCWKALLLYSFTASGYYTIHLLLFQPWSLIFDRRCDLDFPVRVAHSAVSDSLHLVLPWASVLISNSCKMKLPWWGFKDEFNSKSLRVSYIQTMIAIACTNQKFLFLNPMWQGHHLLKTEYAV